MVAAKLGGADPDLNPRLYVAIEKAKKASVYRDTIERAVKKGSGQLDEKVNFETVVYEGFAPHKVPVVVECLTDNRNRTAPEIRNLFKAGSMGQPGSVAFFFNHLGVVEATHTDKESRCRRRRHRSRRAGSRAARSRRHARRRQRRALPYRDQRPRRRLESLESRRLECHRRRDALRRQKFHRSQPRRAQGSRNLPQRPRRPRRRPPRLRRAEIAHGTMASPGQPPNVRGGFFSGLEFAAIRRLERTLSPDAFHQLVALFVRIRRPIKGPRPMIPLPDCLQSAGNQVLSVREKRVADYFNRVLEFFPDQLSSPKWRDRVEFDGLEHLASARKIKKPHRAGVLPFRPVLSPAPLAARRRFPPPPWWEAGREIVRAKRLADAVSPFPQIPTAFHREDQLREARWVLPLGNPLLIALDVETGKQLEVPFDDQWHIRVASGPIRLAIHHEAELLPCSITDQGRWRFRIKLSPPVPQEFLRAGQEAPAVKRIIETLLPEIRAHPEQCAPRVLNLFQPFTSAKNSATPPAYADPMAAR